MSLSKIVEQKNVTDLLLGSIANQRISHAYIFVGPKGVGKSKVALEFAKALNCAANQIDSCDECVHCRRIDHHNSQDVAWIKPDGSTIKIDQIRQLQKDSNYKSVGSNVKFFVIEQAELMTTQAANSLLKFLEEPSQKTVAILLTESLHRLLDTIRSRCQIIHFSHLNPIDISMRMGSMGYNENDALLAAHLTQDMDGVKELLESEQFAQMRSLVIQWSEDILYKNYQVLLSMNDKIMKNDYIKGHLPQFLDLLAIWYRDILSMKLGMKSSIIYKEYEDMLSKQAVRLTQDKLIQAIEEIIKTKDKLYANVNSQLALEHMILALWEG